jgi:hypothetical protein
MTGSFLGIQGNSGLWRNEKLHVDIRVRSTAQNLASVKTATCTTSALARSRNVGLNRPPEFGAAAATLVNFDSLRSDNTITTPNPQYSPMPPEKT